MRETTCSLASLAPWCKFAETVGPACPTPDTYAMLTASHHRDSYGHGSARHMHSALRAAIVLVTDTLFLSLNLW